MLSDTFLFATGDEEDMMDDDEVEDDDVDEDDEEKEGEEGDDLGTEEE